MKQIVCLSTSCWHPYPTRKQQIMGRLDDVEILYFDPPVSYIAKYKDKSAAAKMTSYRDGGEKIRDNLTVYSMPPVLPFFNKNRAVNKINGRAQASFVRRMMAKHGFTDPIIWCYSPTAADIVSHIPHSAVVYDCVDRHSAYKGLISPKVVDKMERDLATKANVVFCTAKGLETTLKKYNSNVLLVPNGANYELFSQASDHNDVPFLPPDELFNVQAPILGFVGALQECIDYSLIIHAAKEHPEWNFVMVGGEQPGVDLSELHKLSNVHLLGLMPHKSLPRYVAYFNVCLNLFRSGDLAKDVSPLKLYEYLSTGKPIVSTPQPDQVLEFADVVYIATSPDDFVARCKTAINEHSDWKVKRRMEFGSASSWSQRVAQMRAYLTEKGVF